MKFETEMQKEHRQRQEQGKEFIARGQAMLQEEYNPELDPDIHLRNWLKAIAVSLLAVPTAILVIGQGSSLAQQYLGQENAITSCANVCIPALVIGMLGYVVFMGKRAE